MDHFAGLDVSVKETSVCIVDDTGKIVREVKVASEPEALLAVLKDPTVVAMPDNRVLTLGHRSQGTLRAVSRLLLSDVAPLLRLSSQRVSPSVMGSKPGRLSSQPSVMGSKL